MMVINYSDLLELTQKETYKVKMNLKKEKQTKTTFKRPSNVRSGQQERCHKLTI